MTVKCSSCMQLRSQTTKEQIKTGCIRWPRQLATAWGKVQGIYSRKSIGMCVYWKPFIHLFQINTNKIEIELNYLTDSDDNVNPLLRVSWAWNAFYEPLWVRDSIRQGSISNSLGRLSNTSLLSSIRSANITQFNNIMNLKLIKEGYIQHVSKANCFIH